MRLLYISSTLSRSLVSHQQSPVQSLYQINHIEPKKKKKRATKKKKKKRVTTTHPLGIYTRKKKIFHSSPTKIALISLFSPLQFKQLQKPFILPYPQSLPFSHRKTPRSKPNTTITNISENISFTTLIIFSKNSRFTIIISLSEKRKKNSSTAPEIQDPRLKIPIFGEYEWGFGLGLGGGNDSRDMYGSHRWTARVCASS